MAWRNDLEKSMDVFDRLILPVFPKLVRGEYIRVEGTDEEIAQMLDKHIGIDAMVDRDGIVFGLGSRIQINSGVWNTFTIRCDRESGNLTEFEKLKCAIENDAMRPHLTMQAYVENDRLQTVAVARTKDIIEYIETHPKECPVRKSFDGRWAKFITVYWSRMRRAGYRVVTYDARHGGG